MNKAVDYSVGNWFFVKGDHDELTLCLAGSPLTPSKYNDETVVWYDAFHNKTMIAKAHSLRACTTSRLEEYHVQYGNEPPDSWQWLNKKKTRKDLSLCKL